MLNASPLPRISNQDKTSYVKHLEPSIRIGLNWPGSKLSKTHPREFHDRFHQKNISSKVQTLYISRDVSLEIYTMECRICHNESEKDPCSQECTEELDSLRLQANWINLSLGEARDEKYEFEATEFGPLYVRFERLQALHRALTLGYHSMNTAYSIEGSEHQEVREWRMQQTKEDKNSLPYVKKYLHRLQHKITELEQELSNAEQNWEDAATKVDSIEDALREIVAITGDDHLLA